MSALKTIEDKEHDLLMVYFTEAKILDDAVIQAIGKELMEATTRAVGGKILLNFTGVGFMSSAMIGKIILLNKKCKNDKINLKLCGIADNVMEVFKIMRLPKVLDIYPDEAKAIAAFEKKGWFGLGS